MDEATEALLARNATIINMLMRATKRSQAHILTNHATHDLCRFMKKVVVRQAHTDSHIEGWRPVSSAGQLYEPAEAVMPPPDQSNSLNSRIVADCHRFGVGLAGLSILREPSAPLCRTEVAP